MQVTQVLLKLHLVPQSKIHLLLDISNISESVASCASNGRARATALGKMQPKITVKRALGPRDITKIVGNVLLRDRKAVLHAGSTKSYKLNLLGMPYKKVVHCKMRVKIKGGWHWGPAHYLQIITHKLSGIKGKTLKVKIGPRS